MTNTKQFSNKIAVFGCTAVLVCSTWNIPVLAADFEPPYGATVYQLSGAQTLKYFTGSQYAFDNLESQLGLRYYLEGDTTQYDANFLYRTERKIDGKTFLQFDCTVPGKATPAVNIEFYGEPNLPEISGVDFEIAAPDFNNTEHPIQYCQFNADGYTRFQDAFSSSGRILLPYQWRWEDSSTGQSGYWRYATVSRIYFENSQGVSEPVPFKLRMWTARYATFAASYFSIDEQPRTNFTIMIGCPKIWWDVDTPGATNQILQKISEQLGGGGHLTPEGVATVTSMENRIEDIESGIYSHFSEEERLLENAISGVEQGASAVSSAFGEIAEGSFDRVNLFGWLAPLTAFVLIPCLFLVIFYIFRR